MQTATSNPSDHKKVSKTLSDLIARELWTWSRRMTGSDVYDDNASALRYVLNLNKFRLRDVNSIIVLGLGHLGTVEQQRANYADQGLTVDQRDTQNAAITQLGVAQIIRDNIQMDLSNHEPVNLHVCDENFTDSIKSILGELGVAQIIRDNIQMDLSNHEPVNLHVCDENFTDSIKSILGELGVTVIGWSDLSRYVNQHSLVYDLTMEGGWLQRAVNLSWQGDMIPPAAVITHMSNGFSDSPSNLVDKYWFSPLMESMPTLIVPEEAFQFMASRPSDQLLYDQWVALQEEHSQNVQRGYVKEAAAHNQRMADYKDHVAYVTGQGQAPFLRMPMPKRSWVWDPMMIMLCRKDCPPPSEGKDEFEGEDESEGED